MAAVGGGVSMEDATNWLNAVLEFGGSADMVYSGPASDRGFRDWISNGAVFLTVMNILCAPDKPKRVNKGNNPMMTGSNFQLYKQGCQRKFNVQDDFDHDTIARGENITPILLNISRLSTAAASGGPPGFNIPGFGPRAKGVMRERTEAELRAARNAVPKAAEGDVAHASANNTDMAGIIKVKGTQQHSASGADLDRGNRGIAYEDANNTDMAGIIKVKGMEQHSAGASTNYGSLATATSNNTDMAGIVRVQGTDQHSATGAVGQAPPGSQSRTGINHSDIIRGN